MATKGKPKQKKFDPFGWRNDPHPHIRNWFSSLSMKKLKGEARKKKLKHLMESF